MYKLIYMLYVHGKNVDNNIFHEFHEDLTCEALEYFFFWKFDISLFLLIRVINYKKKLLIAKLWWGKNEKKTYYA